MAALIWSSKVCLEMILVLRTGPESVPLFCRNLFNCLNLHCFSTSHTWNLLQQGRLLLAYIPRLEFTRQGCWTCLHALKQRYLRIVMTGIVSHVVTQIHAYVRGWGSTVLWLVCVWKCVRVCVCVHVSHPRRGGFVRRYVRAHTMLRSHRVIWE